MNMDRYPSFCALQASETEGRDFRIRSRTKRGKPVVIAIHGGKIEPGTSEIARAIAGNTLSFYAFEGIKRSQNALLHILSTRFDEPRCLHLVRASPSVFSIHGESSTAEVVFLGGKDKHTLQRLCTSLQKRGFCARNHANSRLQGQDPTNICSRGTKGAGVQLEVSAGLRRTFFRSLSAKGRTTKTSRFRQFVAAVRKVIAAENMERPNNRFHLTFCPRRAKRK